MKKILFLLVITLIFTSIIYSQDVKDRDLIALLEASYNSDEPSWLLMERGKQAYEISELGIASRIFREIIDREGVYPDAEVWLAYIFEQEGEYSLAEKQYLKALEQKNNLYILEDEYTILYKLAEIYKKTDQWGKYESTLLTLIENDNGETGSIDVQYRILDVLKQQGIDKMFELFRFKSEKYNLARKELGIFYYQTGRYTDAEINLILPLLSAATYGYDYIYSKTAVYEFNGFGRHVSEMMKHPATAELIEADNFFETMYFLAAALFADGYTENALSLWTIVIENTASDNIWRRRSERQLRSPYIEPIITRRS